MFVVLFLASCSPGVDRGEEPKNLIEKEKMVEIVTELMKLEGHASAEYVQVTRYNKMIQASADSLFKKKGVTAKQYRASYQYYAYQQTDLAEIYEKVLDNLNHEMTDLELQEQKKKKENPPVPSEPSL